jgi:hypothetical protein
MPTYGTRADGFVKKPREAIIAEMAERQRTDPALQIDPAPDTLVGKHNGIFADQLAQLWEVHQANFYALSRDGAQGAALDIIGALNGRARRPASKSTVALTLAMAAGTTVRAGSIVSAQGHPEVRVVTLQDASAPADGGPVELDILAAAETAGPVTAIAGALTVIETPVNGWSAVTNSSSLSGGKSIESDEEYLLRQLDEIAAGGGGTLPGLRADLLQLEGVDDVLMIENDADGVVNGMPGHSIEAVVLGGEDAAIAQSLWTNKAGGVALHGSEPPITITDDQGSRLVRFSRPTERPVYVAIDLVTAGGVDVEGLKTAIVEASIPVVVSIGEDVYGAPMVCVAFEWSANVLNAQAGLSFSPISNAADGEASLSIGQREIGTLQTADIVVNVV